MAKKNQSAFEKALTDAALSRYQKILDEDTSPVQLSDTYQDSVAKLTNKSSQKTWKYVNTAWKRMLVGGYRFRRCPSSQRRPDSVLHA